MLAPRKAEIVSTCEVVFPQDTNHYGTLFGGALISWMDKAAYYASVRYSGFPSVTASVEHIDFSVSIRTGDLLEIKARVIHTGHSSMVVKVDVHKTSLGRPDEKILANEGCFTFVALDETGRPRAVPPLLVETEEESRLHELGARIKARAASRRRPGNGV